MFLEIVDSLIEVDEDIEEVQVFYFISIKLLAKSLIMRYI